MYAMGYDIRRLTRDDLPAAWEMTRVAFGIDGDPPPSWSGDRAGRLDWGAFDRRGRLVAKCTDRDQGHWFGGRLVPASGIAGVVVAPELRGTGLAGTILRAMLAGARERGAVITTLYRSAPGPYRSLGCEEVGAWTTTAVPASALAELRRPDGIDLRPAGPGDYPRVREIYATVARAGNGLIERSGPLYADDPDQDGVTLAVAPDGTVEGYASWSRDGGYEETGRVRVDDLIGLTGRATTALLANLGTWSRVAPTVLLRLPEPDPAAFVASLVGTTVERRRPWMLGVLDPAAAVAARGWPRGLAGSVDLRLDSGDHRLTLDRGAGRLEPGGSGAVELTARGLAVLYAGAAGPALLRRAGLLAGGDAEADAFLEAAVAGPAPALLDYF